MKTIKVAWPRLWRWLFVIVLFVPMLGTYIFLALQEYMPKFYKDIIEFVDEGDKV